jgi:putative tryptophan/tyrosine transport system substrate-binding protein
MRRREFLAVLGYGVSAWPLTAFAQQPAGRVAKVAIISPFLRSAAPSPAFDAFSGTLRGLGWVEGRNVLFERRWAEGHADRLPALADELVQLRPDVIFSAWGTPTALALKKATTDIPIVFAGVGDAIGVGLVESLVRPGGNLTGSTFISELTVAKQLELLREIVPTFSRVGVLINPSNPVRSMAPC